jgi:YrbI family 3-deoxy-D-manno-octulosonate 8-phosphate phosphatase
VTGGPEEVLAIIPARGGSVGIPRKNVRPLGGRPLIAWSIAHARRSPSVTRVVVSTDDAEIAAVSRRHGAEVVERPAALATATASSESALRHALDTLRAREGYAPDLVVFLQCTSPLRRPDDVEAAIETLRREEADSLFSCGPSHGFLWRREAHGPRPLSYDPAARPRRQDAPEDVVENGSIYLFRPWVLRETGSRLGGRIATYPMPLRDSFQVDEPEDLALLEALLASRAPARRPTAALAEVELLLLDFDGVLTDDRVRVDQHGTEAVTCHRGDGWGIARLREAGVSVEVVSTETNPVVAARCAKLSIPCRQGVRDKRRLVAGRIAEAGLAPAQVAFVGNDVNDLGALELVGVPVAVADATAAARAAAIWVTERRGGDGAVREVADAILEARAAAAAPAPEVRHVA